MTECLVCLEEKKFFIECCDKPCCTSCTERYLLQLKDTPRCMFCKTHWDRHFLAKKLRSGFLKKEYRKVEEELFIAREKLLLPRYETWLKIQDLEEEKKEVGNYSDYSYKYKTFLKQNGFKDSLDISEHYKKINTLMKRCQKSIVDKIEVYKQKLNIVPKEVKQIRSCLKSGCTGVLDNWKCICCKTTFCVDCLEETNNKKEHKCDPQILETMKEINKNTKPCPKCFVPIQKDGGCDQMYCVYCDVSFYWSTGHINRGVIHNPEYFRKMREKGVEVKNNRCVEDPNYIVEEIQRNLEGLNLLILCTIVELEDYRPLRIDGMSFDEKDLIMNGTLFIRGEIDLVEWKRRTYCSYKGLESYLGYNKMGRMYKEMVIHLYLTCVSEKNDEKFNSGMIELAKDLIQDVGEWSSFIGRKYKNVYHFRNLTEHVK